VALKVNLLPFFKVNLSASAPPTISKVVIMFLNKFVSLLLVISQAVRKESKSASKLLLSKVGTNHHFGIRPSIPTLNLTTGDAHDISNSADQDNSNGFFASIAYRADLQAQSVDLSPFIRYAGKYVIRFHLDTADVVANERR
jgi:hypothetical protein